MRLSVYWGDLTDVQRRFEEACRSNDRVVLRCGRQVGKTEYLARRVVRGVLRGHQIWWLAPTHQLTRVGFLRCMHLVRKLPRGIASRIRVRRSAPYRVECGVGWCDFLTTRTPESLQGATLHEVVVDEAASVRDLEYLLAQYVEPTLAVRRGKLILASTPRGLNDFYRLAQSPYFVEVHASSYESPYISAEWLESQRVRYVEEGRELAFRQEYLAEWIRESGHFFERLPVVVDECPDAGVYIAGIDWGYSSPFAVVGVSVQGGVVYVVREVYRRRLDADEQARMALELNAQRYVCDPSTPAHVLETWRMAGLSPEPGLADRVGGWDLMRQLIRHGRLVVHRSCFHLLDEFQRAEVSLRRVDDLEGDDHALDALRYALLYAERKAYIQSRLERHNEELHAKLRGDAVLAHEMEEARRQYVRRASRGRRYIR